VGHSDLTLRHTLAQAEKSAESFQAWIGGAIEAMTWSPTFFSRLVVGE